MTSGIPTYDDQPAWYADYAADPHAYFSPEQLVGYVLDAPATSGYSYSNTNYVLAEMIIERVTGDSYQDQLYRRDHRAAGPARPATTAPTSTPPG